jgi:peptidyl-prolyl cis-trans isomerase D
MFDFVRNHTRWVMFFLLVLIIPSFVFFGVQGYARFGDDAARSALRIDGRDISRGELQVAHQRNIDRVRREAPNVDPALLDSPEFKQQTIDNLVRERVLAVAAADKHLYPADERLKRLFVSDPQFAQIRNPDGTVSREFLSSQGYTSEGFAQLLRSDVGMRQVLQGISSSSLAPAASVGRALDALLQRREMQWQLFDPTPLRAQVQASEADLEAYLKANEAEFRIAERAQIEYAVLDLEALKKGLSVPQEDLRRYYTENASRFTAKEERRASHILIKVDPAASAEAKAQAKARADALLEQLRKTPNAFAELAKKNSQDEGSAANGGDLGFFGRDAMVKPFEDAAYSMKAGEISNVVTTDFGYHIIQLTAVRGGEKQAFEAVRAEIEAEVKRSLAQRRYAEAAEQFSNTVFEQSDSLQPVADKLGLPMQRATVGRAPAAGGEGPLGSAKLLQAVFGNEALRNKRNTEAVDLGNNRLVSARVVQYEPARVPALAEVRDKVRERVVATQAAALAGKQAEAKLQALKASPDTALPNTSVVSRVQGQGLPRELLEQALKQPADTLPAPFSVNLGDRGTVVAKITQVLSREPVPGGEAALGSQYAQAWGDAETRAYLAALKTRYKVEVKPSPWGATSTAAAGVAAGQAGSAPGSSPQR